MKTKTMTLVIGMLVWCVMAGGGVSSAHAAHWSTTKDGVTFDCTVDVKNTIFFVWTEIELKYEFCGHNNNAIYSAVVASTGSGSQVGSWSKMDHRCDGKNIRFNSPIVTFPGNTPNARSKFCEDLFNAADVSVTPIK